MDKRGFKWNKPADPIDRSALEVLQGRPGEAMTINEIAVAMGLQLPDWQGGPEASRTRTRMQNRARNQVKWLIRRGEPIIKIEGREPDPERGVERVEQRFMWNRSDDDR